MEDISQPQIHKTGKPILIHKVEPKSVITRDHEYLRRIPGIR